MLNHLPRKVGSLKRMESVIRVMPRYQYGATINTRDLCYGHAQPTNDVPFSVLTHHPEPKSALNVKTRGNDPHLIITDVDLRISGMIYTISSVDLILDAFPAYVITLTRMPYIRTLFCATLTPSTKHGLGYKKCAFGETTAPHCRTKHVCESNKLSTVARPTRCNMSWCCHLCR